MTKQTLINLIRNGLTNGNGVFPINYNIFLWHISYHQTQTYPTQVFLSTRKIIVATVILKLAILSVLLEVVSIIVQVQIYFVQNYLSQNMCMKLLNDMNKRLKNNKNATKQTSIPVPIVGQIQLFKTQFLRLV